MEASANMKKVILGIDEGVGNAMACSHRTRFDVLMGEKDGDVSKSGKRIKGRKVPASKVRGRRTKGRKKERRGIEKGIDGEEIESGGRLGNEIVFG